MPRGSCEVVQAVASMRCNHALTHVTRSGLVDSDGLHANEFDALSALGVSVLPVSENANLFLLPSVSRAIAGKVVLERSWGVTVLRFFEALRLLCRQGWDMLSGFITLNAL